MVKLIQALIFLALIAGIIIGAKVMMFDPMKKDKELQDAKKTITKLYNAEKYQEAIDACDVLLSDYPKQKQFIKGRKFSIYSGWAEKQLDAGENAIEEMGRAKNESDKGAFLRAKKKKEDSGLLAYQCLEEAQKYGNGEDLHQDWLARAYRLLGKKKQQELAQKAKERATQTQKERVEAEPARDATEQEDSPEDDKGE